MYDQVEKAKSNCIQLKRKERPIRDNLFNWKSSTENTFSSSIDNPDAFSTQRKQLSNTYRNSVLNVSNNSWSHQDGVMQLALPGSYDVADAPWYNPQGKKATYNSDVPNYNRLASSGFTDGWREKMIDYWDDIGWVNHQKNPDGSSIRYIKVPFHGWVHENGIQLDHATSVASMINDYESFDPQAVINSAYNNNELKNYYHIEDEDQNNVPWPGSKKKAEKTLTFDGFTVEPTVHGARKYYHDRGNLVPLMGVDNASKGDSSDDIPDWDSDDLDIEKEWMDMTSWANNSVQNQDIDDLDNAVEAMRETLDGYNGDWPI